jgi:hypothetical protein
LKGELLAKQVFKIIPAWCFLCSFFLAVPFLRAESGSRLEENEVVAIGTGVIAGGNLANAKKAAVSRALVRGVENYLVRRLGNQGMANNFERLLQEIIPRAEEAVENFNILAREQIGSQVKVLVRLSINETVLDEKLRQAGIVVVEGPPIRILFMVSEVRDGTFSFWWEDPEIRSGLSTSELALYKAFQERGFSPINRVLSLPETEYGENLRSPDLQEVDVLRWGTLFSADAVIYGRTEIIQEKNVSISLEVFDVAQGNRICQDILSEPVSAGPEVEDRIAETLYRAFKLLAARLTPFIVRIRALGQEMSSRLEITMKGLSSYKQFRIFRDFLRRDVTGVKSVRQTRVTKDSISIVVEFKGTGRRFMDRVINHKNLPFLLNLHEVEEGKIMLNVI